MASLDILCFNPFNLRNEIMKIEQKIFHGSSKILKNVLWPINICQKYFMAPTKPPAPPPPPPYILNVRSLIILTQTNDIIFTMKYTKWYVSVVTLSAKDNQNPAKFLRKGFQRSVYWNEYKVEKQLIVGATKTIKHKIKKQEGGFDVT